MSGTMLLDGVVVVELGDARVEYAGRLLASLGATVTRIEIAGTDPSRAIGPFTTGPDGEQLSLYHLHYNASKRSVSVGDVADPRVEGLIRDADLVLFDASAERYGALAGLLASAGTVGSGTVVVEVSAFGDTGPWARYKGSDLVHLALGGVMKNCGYDPDVTGRFDEAPMAPQMWQAYHIAGEHAVIAGVIALLDRQRTGAGDVVRVNVHQSVATNTETDVPNWVYLNQIHRRQTGRHSRPYIDYPTLSRTKDGRYWLPYRTYLPGFSNTFSASVEVAREAGVLDPAMDLEDAGLAGKLALAQVLDFAISREHYDSELWVSAQNRGLPWSQVRRPEENLDDAHWWTRDTFAPIDLGGGITGSQIRGKWHCRAYPWREPELAPTLGQHNGEQDPVSEFDAEHAPADESRASWPLVGVKVVDLSWLLASGGAGRYLAAHGADVIKVEHSSRPDAMRWGVGGSPLGGREERERATGALTAPKPTSPNRSGVFNEIHAGKRSLGLNLKSPEGREVLLRLIEDADVLLSGFSPGTLERMGLSIDALHAVNPRLISVKQSGLGEFGEYGELRSYGPTAQAFSGLTEMSGLPEPYAPAGIGYSYLDWYGAYNMALATVTALYRRSIDGAGFEIDCSQVEAGIFLTGTAVLDWSLNGNGWQRPATPSVPDNGFLREFVFRVAGDDQWVAVSCADERDVDVLRSVLGAGGDDETALREAALAFEPYTLMSTLQGAGVAAGVCQDAPQRFMTDPQLAHLGWVVELPHSEIGAWPIRALPFTFERAHSHIGGSIGRGGPLYGEDTDAVLAEHGFTAAEIEHLRTKGVIE